MAQDPTTPTTPQDGLDALAARFNIDPKLLRTIVSAGVDSGEFQLNPTDTFVDDALRGVAVLGRIVQGQVPPLHPDGPAALEALLTALVRRAELRPIGWDDAEARPKIDGLPESLTEWAALKEKQGQRLALASASIDELRHLATTITIKRGYLEVSVALQQAFEADVAVDENRAKLLLEGDVAPLRASLESHQDLGPGSAKARDYLFGPARRGADTRATLAQRRKAWTAQASTTARVAGIDEGMRRMEERVQAAIDGPEAPVADTSDRRADPRR